MPFHGDRKKNGHNRGVRKASDHQRAQGVTGSPRSCYGRYGVVVVKEREEAHHPLKRLAGFREVFFCLHTGRSRTGLHRLGNTFKKSVVFAPLRLCLRVFDCIKVFLKRHPAVAASIRSIALGVLRELVVAALTGF